ncbi:MAG: DUF4974 domain-containing protein [Muribaculaceae bacterium]|nr:DUF4974 domain-containing protein [Muribaculaceae bacterium]
MQHISKLFIKRLTGHLSEAEEAELQAWASASRENRDLFDRLTNATTVKETLDLWHMIDSDKACREMQAKVNRMLLPRRILRYTAIAASVAIIAGLAILLRDNGSTIPSSPNTIAGDTHITVGDIKPGTTCATLSVAPGHKVTLSATDTASVTARLLETYETTVTDQETAVENLCLDVPRGGEFKILLEDGSEVWLNSASRLYYPKSFSKDERKIRVEGEVYLSVAQDSLRPFYVESGRQLVRVYGTEFNIRHYPEDNEVYTTLEKGCISLTCTDGNSGEFFISPGHQGVFTDTDSKVQVRSVNTDVVTSWRKGRFVFEHQNLRRIMQDLSRWYDFDYEFTDSSLETEEFMGSIPRYADFTTAISILEKCGGIHFAVADGKVIISRTAN